MAATMAASERIAMPWREASHPIVEMECNVARREVLSICIVYRVEGKTAK
jgi:hypothetical protein